MARRSQLDWRKAQELIASATEEICLTEISRNPVVSVCLVTYSHRNFIGEALESVLAQETDFPFELVVGDDCSTDGTTDVVLEFQRQHPDKIRVLLAKENLGKYTGNGRLNFIRTIRACRGKYIALLDGDDYWTSASKLQQQVDFMDAHTDCTLCFHDIVKVDEHGEQLAVSPLPAAMKRRLANTEILMSKFPVPPTASMVLRREMIGELPDWFLQAPYGDRAIASLVTRSGDAGYIDGVISAYRIHSGGIISKYGRLGVIKGEITARKMTVANFAANRAACDYNCERIVDFYREALKHCVRNRDWKDAVKTGCGLAWFGCRHRHVAKRAASVLAKAVYQGLTGAGSTAVRPRENRSQA